MSPATGHGGYVDMQIRRQLELLQNLRPHLAAIDYPVDVSPEPDH